MLGSKYCIRNNLLQQLAKIDEKIKREDIDLQTFDEAMITTLLDHNLRVNILQVISILLSLQSLFCHLQRKLDDATATKLQKQRKLENITEAHFEKRYT